MHSALTKIRIQSENFILQEEYEILQRNNKEDGAIVCFSGRVRDLNENDQIQRMRLEYYPGMTEKTLKRLAEEAREKWNLHRINIVHRVGDLYPSDQIVFIGVSSPHRREAFNGASFLMDYLKTQAPFWKKETFIDGTSRWLDSRDVDRIMAQRWVCD